MNTNTMKCLSPTYAILGLVVLLYPTALYAQSDVDTQGTPIENDLVVENCASCHAQDDSGRMTRLSYMRKTPEGW